MSGLSWDEIDRLMGEDPDDRAIREAHGFSYEDDYRDRSLLCRNGCGATYYDIAVGKMCECSAVPGVAYLTPEEFVEFTRRHGVRWEEM